MSWARLCDTLHAHPKATAAGLEAVGLWCLTLSHCGAYLTDGHVSRATGLRVAGAPEVLDRLGATLVRVGLWVPHPSGDGWQVHDYCAFNPMKVDVVAERAAKSRAGRDTAAKRWGPLAGSSSNSCSVAPATRAATPPADAPVPIPIPIPIRPDPEKKLAPPAPLTLTGEPSAAAERSSSSRAKRERRHTPGEIAAKDRIVDAFVERFEATKGVKPKSIPAADHAAAFALAKTYGPDEGSDIVRRAFEDDFVVSKNATLRFIGSKADTFRGTVPSLTRTTPRNAIAQRDSFAVLDEKGGTT